MQSKKTNQEESEQIKLLVKQARLDLRETGRTTVLCPKCGQHPKVIMSTSSRFVMYCECRYLHDGEIYL